MANITKNTAGEIWNAHRNIAEGEKMLAEIQEAIDEAAKREPEQLDQFGRHRSVELHYPHGTSGHRIFDVNPQMALSVIRSHIASKKAELQQLSEQARIELNTL
jgi:hypothetical protein